MCSYQKIKIHMILSYEYVLYIYIEEIYIVTIWWTSYTKNYTIQIYTPQVRLQLP
jgi:hypothetical protein